MQRLFIIFRLIANQTYTQPLGKLPFVATGSVISMLSQWLEIDSGRKIRHQTSRSDENCCFCFHKNPSLNGKWIIFRTNFEVHSDIYGVSLDKEINYNKIFRR